LQRVTPLKEIIVSDEWNWGSVRLITLLSAPMALGMVACTSEESPTEPSAEVSPARAAAKTYTAVDLGTLGGAKSEAWAINPAGQVVGGSETAPGSFQNHAFLWEKGAMTDLGTLGGGSSAATGINPAGQIVGGSEMPERLPSGEIPTHPFLWEKGVMIDLGTLGGNQA
jgi:probable HAF family extracellular repeat protein